MNSCPKCLKEFPLNPCIEVLSSISTDFERVMRPTYVETSILCYCPFCKEQVTLIMARGDRPIEPS